MSRILFGLSLLAGLIPFVAADGLFIGCSQSYPYQDASNSFPSGSFSSATDCAAQCGGYTYSYLFYYGQCVCSNTGPSATSLTDGDEDTCAQRSSISVNIVSTTFDSTTCYSDQDFAAADFPGLYPITDPKQCLNSCANDRLAVLQSEDSAGWYSTASGLARRNAREAVAQAKRDRIFNVCPGGMTACLVPGLEKNEAWECIDTQNDMESCGGCLHGTFNNATTAVGVSCAKPGVKLGAATCAAGKCLISECKDGFKLVDSQCVVRA
uniref:Protein CPL1-like domain-containing protein n=1 Tax=Kwoniella bestiolae CBS 10118 TaxID=1296100 RepID=A0A1B9FZN1_9TREE|nr:hypothetical protein I302_05685 [Kwoniella bestiolae CBS 10118]OCF24226.1 hypothetical protein I302_05685 [Kwoniella bestiolae CBS 10118]